MAAGVLRAWLAEKGLVMVVEEMVVAEVGAQVRRGVEGRSARAARQVEEEMAVVL